MATLCICSSARRWGELLDVGAGMREQLGRPAARAVLLDEARGGGAVMNLAMAGELVPQAKVGNANGGQVFGEFVDLVAQARPHVVEQERLGAELGDAVTHNSDLV